MSTFRYNPFQHRRSIMSDIEKAIETGSCDQCYRTKQSCSRGLPSCQRCEGSSTTCTYSFGKFLGKPKKSLTKRRARGEQRHGTRTERSNIAKRSDRQQREGFRNEDGLYISDRKANIDLMMDRFLGLRDHASP